MAPGGGRSSAHRLSGASREKIKWIQLARIGLDGSLLIYSSWGADPAQAGAGVMQFLVLRNLGRGSRGVPVLRLCTQSRCSS